MLNSQQSNMNGKLKWADPPSRKIWKEVRCIPASKEVHPVDSKTSRIRLLT